MTRPASIESLVRGARGRTRLARAFESAALGLGAALSTSAAAVMSGADASSLAALCVCAIAGLACAATWWSEHRGTLVESARRADRRLELDGALVAAFETRGGGVAGLLAERVLARIPSDAASRAAHKPAAAFLGIPLAAAALLAAAHEAAPELAPLPQTLTSLSAALGDASHSSASSDESAVLVELAGQARSLAKEAARPSAAPADLARSLATLARDLRRVNDQRARAGARELPADLARADELVREALSHLAAASGGSLPAEAGSESSAPSQNSAAASTMAGSPRPNEAPATPLDSPAAPPTAPVPEAGTIGGRWWPEQYDAVVAAWFAERGQH